MSDLDKINESIEKIGGAFEEHKKNNDALIEAKASKKAVGELEEKQAKIDADMNSLLEMKSNLEKVEAAVSRMGGDVSGESESKSFDKEAFASALKKSVRQNFENVTLTEAETKAMQSNIDPDGGYTVMPFIGGTETIEFDTSNVRSLATVQTIGTNTYCGFFDDERQPASWVGEVDSRPSTGTAQLGKLNVPVHTIYARPPVSEELLEDSSWNLEQFVQQKAALEFSLEEEAAFVSGDGVNKPQGFLSGTQKTSNPAVYARGEVGTLTAAGATDITSDEIIDLRALLKSGYRGNAYFAYNRATEAYIRKLKDGQGNYLWTPSFQAGEPDMLIGQRTAVMEDMPDIASGALSVALADFRRTYLIVDRLGMSVLRDPFTQIPYVSFYMRKRVGGAIKNYDTIKYLKQA